MGASNAGAYEKLPFLPISRFLQEITQDTTTLLHVERQ